MECLCSPNGCCRNREWRWVVHYLSFVSLLALLHFIILFYSILSFIRISSFCYTPLLSCPFVTNNCLIFRYRLVSCWSRGQSGTDQVRHFQNLSQSLYIPTGRVHCCFWCFILSADDRIVFSFVWFWVYFQGGPYHDVLHSILGAYTCYRPDVGYVSRRLVYSSIV